MILATALIESLGLGKFLIGCAFLALLIYSIVGGGKGGKGGSGGSSSSGSSSSTTPPSTHTT